MSWPQNPQQPHNPQQPPQPLGGGGFGAAPAWEATAVDQPAVNPSAAPGVHAQPTVFAQPVVTPPPPPAPPPPQPPRNNKTLFAVIGGAVALAVLGGGAFFLLKDDGKKSDEAKKVIAPDPGRKDGKDVQPSPSGPSGAQPVAAGWQTQTAMEYGFRYDVPGKADNWTILPRDTMTSYVDEAGKPQITMRDPAHFREGGCSSNANPNAAFGEAGKGQLATVGTMGGDTSLSIQENARNWAGNWGFFAYGGKAHKPKIEVSEAKPWRHNGIDGWTATAKVTVTNRPSPCVPPTAIVKSIVEKRPDGKFHSWVVYADQGVPDALPEAEIDKIMGTVRPVKG
ncbi:hypothetical protein [Streptomyces sp. NPDC002537]